MDHATELSLRLKQYAAAIAAAGSQHTDDHAIEEWLGFWDDEDSAYGNVRNIEHWLSQAAARRTA
jgi:hypothetical protein